MKKSVKLVAALAICGVLTVAGTLAYMSSTTDTKKNVFTIGSGVDGEITEPNWPGNDGSDVVYTPSSTIKKDPMVTNTSEKESVYVGMKLEYRFTEDALSVYNTNNKTDYTSMEALLEELGYADAEAYIKGITTLSFNTDAEGTAAVDSEWFAATGVENSYYYAKKGDATTPLAVVSGVTTNPLFGAVTISNKITIKEMLPFEISATGYVVQTTDITNAEAIDELSKLMETAK